MKLRVAIHKFTSCDGCQLQLLNLGERLLALAERMEIRHFSEAGICNPEAEVDLALVEGSISTPEEVERIARIRARSQCLVSLGACATAGGIQALRNLRDPAAAWPAACYPHPEYLAAAPRSQALSSVVPVDLELHGCPIDSDQLLTALYRLMAGGSYRPTEDAVCIECKRAGHACVLVTRGAPCMGPVTRAGCGALCPGAGRACYGCFGPAVKANTASLRASFARLGLSEGDIMQRFEFITSGAEAFASLRNTGGR